MGSFMPYDEVISCSRFDPTAIARWRIIQSVDHNQNPPPPKYFLVGYRMDEGGLAAVHAWWNILNRKVRMRVTTVIDERIVDITVSYQYEARSLSYHSWERSVKVRTCKLLRVLRQQTGVA